MNYPGIELFTIGKAVIKNCSIQTKDASPVQARFGASLDIRQTDMKRASNDHLLIEGLRLQKITDCKINGKSIPNVETSQAPAENAVYAPNCVPCTLR